MKIYARMAITVGTFLTVCAGEAANAATTIDTDFNTTAVSVTPDTADVAAATSIGFLLLPISNVVTDNTGIMLFGTLPVLTNPAPVGVRAVVDLELDDRQRHIYRCAHRDKRGRGSEHVADYDRHRQHLWTRGF